MRSVVQRTHKVTALRLGALLARANTCTRIKASESEAAAAPVVHSQYSFDSLLTLLCFRSFTRSKVSDSDAVGRRAELIPPAASHSAARTAAPLCVPLATHNASRLGLTGSRSQHRHVNEPIDTTCAFVEGSAGNHSATDSRGAADACAGRAARQVQLLGAGRRQLNGEASRERRTARRPARAHTGRTRCTRAARGLAVRAVSCRHGSVAVLLLLCSAPVPITDQMITECVSCAEALAFGTQRELLKQLVADGETRLPPRSSRATQVARSRSCGMRNAQRYSRRATRVSSTRCSALRRT